MYYLSAHRVLDSGAGTPGRVWKTVYISDPKLPIRLGKDLSLAPYDRAMFYLRGQPTRAGDAGGGIAAGSDSPSVERLVREHAASARRRDFAIATFGIGEAPPSFGSLTFGIGGGGPILRFAAGLRPAPVPSLPPRTPVLVPPCRGFTFNTGECTSFDREYNDKVRTISVLITSALLSTTHCTLHEDGCTPAGRKVTTPEMLLLLLDTYVVPDGMKNLVSNFNCSFTEITPLLE
ncbi:hypothetical protein DFH09DRAFT_1285009 [Mycena vulgaris]|nr:hypothetical protein DFH09DRAFT_1285009 [Mycena vulgaris]